MTRTFALLLAAACAVGCGSSASNGEPHHPKEDHHQGGHHKHELKGAMKAFHDVLAPVYHMDKSPARDDKACASTGSMKDGAAKVAAEPSGDAAEWKAKAEALAQNVEGLDKACKADGKAEVSAKLELVHDAFHALMKAQK